MMTDLDIGVGGREVAVSIDTTAGEAQIRWSPDAGGFEVRLQEPSGVVQPWHGPFAQLDALEAATAFALPKRARELLESDRAAEPARSVASSLAPRTVELGSPSGLIAYREGRIERYRTETIGAYVGSFDAKGNAQIQFEDGKRQIPVRHVAIDSPDGLAWGYDGAGPRDT
jgi:hypothetical protein